MHEFLEILIMLTDEAEAKKKNEIKRNWTEIEKAEQVDTTIIQSVVR